MLPLLVFVYLGGYFIKGLALVISILAVMEFIKVHREDGIYGSLPIAIGSTVILYALCIMHAQPILYMGWFAVSILACLLMILNHKKHIVEDATVTIIGIVYVVFMLFHLAWLSDVEGYKLYVWMIIISAFVTDIGAYFIGLGLGKKKLCPELSPKKTIAGAVGGVVTCAVASVIYAMVLAPGQWIHFLIMGIIASVAAQAGDLIASGFKRSLEVKDYGKLIPGHGGVMDRIDSLLFTAPVIFWYIQFFMH